MPDEVFINPYNFIPVSGKVDRNLNYYTQEKYQGYSGTIHVDLETKTRLFIPDRRLNPQGENEPSPEFTWTEKLKIEGTDDYQKNKRGEIKTHPHYSKFLTNEKGTKIIPASSLKGMLRSYAETMSDSCFAAYQKKNKGSKESKYPISEYHPNKCDPAGAGLCPCCRIFGTTAGDGDKEDNICGNLKSRVRIEDAELQGSLEKIDISAHRLKLLSSPKPQRHAPFYFDDNGNILGRKFYYHFHSQSEDFTYSEKSNQNCTIYESILAGATFKFKIHFESLEDKELALLLYSIVLDRYEDEKTDNRPMAHKVGMAKPLGFGSVQLGITKLEIVEGGSLYDDFSPPPTIPDRPADDTIKQYLMNSPFAGVGDKYDIWRFPRTAQPTTVHYPDRRWFNKDKDPLVTQKYPLPRNGELPEKYTKYEPPQKTTLEIVKDSIVVEILEWVKKDQVRAEKEDGTEIKAECLSRGTKVGEKIVVKETPSGTYKYLGAPPKRN